MTEHARAARPHGIGRVFRSSWFYLVIVLVVMALVQGFVVKQFRVSSGSMEPTLEVGDRVLMNRLAYIDDDPKQGDVIVFNRPDGWGPEKERSRLRIAAGWVGDIVGFGVSNLDPYVKRVIAGPGQTVSCCSDAGNLLVDGEEQPAPSEAYDLPFVAEENDCASTPRSLRCFDEVRVPDDMYFVLGDNRQNSDDSVGACRRAPDIPVDSCVRFVPRSELMGSAWSVVWPLSEFGSVRGLPAGE